MNASTVQSALADRASRFSGRSGAASPETRPAAGEVAANQPEHWRASNPPQLRKQATVALPAGTTRPVGADPARELASAQKSATSWNFKSWKMLRSAVLSSFPGSPLPQEL